MGRHTLIVRDSGGTTTTAEVTDDRIVVNGTGYEVTRVGPGTYRVSDGTHAETAYVAGSPEARWVFLGGRVYHLDVSREGASRRRAGAADQGLSAPMPATVARVLVVPGQAVKAGDVLLALEAMKMELPIKTPRDGTVKAIRCEQGDLVQPGMPLIEIA